MATASFGGGSGPASTPQDLGGYIRSLDWGNGDAAAAALNTFMMQNGYNTNDVANTMNLDQNAVAQGARDHGYTEIIPDAGTWNGGGLGLATGTSNPYAYANSATPEYLAANGVAMGPNNPNSPERQAAIAAAPAPGAGMPVAAPQPQGALAVFGGSAPSNSGQQQGALTSIAAPAPASHNPFGYTDEQMTNIRGAWNDFTSGRRNSGSIRSDMSKYGVSADQIAAVMGLSAAQVEALLNGTSGSGSGLGGGYTGQPTTVAPQYRPLNPTNHLPAPTPYEYNSAQGKVPSYFPASYWKNSQKAYGGMSVPGYAEGGAVAYNSDRVDEIYNQLKGL